jgi:ABC-2 type transport system ATP-binding protein
LKKYFGKTRAVDDISFDVEAGEIFGFLGPNGAGKTTTIRCMLDFIRPTEGKVEILNKNAQCASVELKNEIGYLSGNARFYDKWTGAEHIDFAKALVKKPDISQDLCERFDFNVDSKIKNLSSGNRQKLGVILAFMFQPKILILDEPTNALDPILQNEVYGLIQHLAKAGSTVFMSSHNLAEVERICHRIGIIRKGKMAAIESIQTLKDKRMQLVQVAFNDKFSIPEFNFDGVQVVKNLGDRLVLNVKGDINPLIKKISQHSIKDLHIEHVPLEEIFLEFYEK